LTFAPVRRSNSPITSIESSSPAEIYSPQLYTFKVPPPLSAPGTPKIAIDTTQEPTAAAAAAQTQPEPAQEISVDPEMPVQPDVEPALQPKPEPILMTRFYAKGTKAQLIGLKNYLEKEGIEYGNV